MTRYSGRFAIRVYAPYFPHRPPPEMKLYRSLTQYYCDTEVLFKYCGCCYTLNQSEALR